MVARWISVLESYNFIIEHRKGSQHTNADALSRKPYRLCKRDDCPGCDKDKGCVKVNPLMAENDQDLDNTIPYEDNLEQNETIPHTEDSDDINESLDFSNWLRIWSNEEIKSWQENDSDLIKIIQLKTQSDEKPSRTVPLAWSLIRDSESESDGEENYITPELSFDDLDQEEGPGDNPVDNTIFTTPIPLDNTGVVESLRSH
ncbi:unnamed protein product [Mytilus edulis]|uniref:Uncharacterized protein n=1 Tax=Mytilus edulis TaxID=6550 RepID=A0A8S3TR86_MYTED|nr:unnamed protein product [Mytilus edulis]